MFWMLQGETIYDVQKGFTYNVNHLPWLGKSFDVNELNIQILKSLNRSWQPKVTTITECQNLATMSMADLFGKVRDHELELRKLNDEEEERKKKHISLKYKISKGKEQVEDDDFECEIKNRMVKKFAKFLKSINKGKWYKKENQSSTSNYKCYGCREIGLVKFDCPSQSEEKKGKNFMKKKKNKVFYDSSSSSSSSDLNVKANLCLIANNECICNKVSYSSLFSESNDYDALLYDFQELYAGFENFNYAHRKLKP